MTTSSITRNFVVEGEEQVQMFANAIEVNEQAGGYILAAYLWRAV